jgi:catechol 2,3-dioxygenase-like lactoylglutathione lyase family enzyme
MPQMQGVSHVALTVGDLAKSAAWYERLFEGAVRVMEGHDGGINYIVYLLPSGLVFGLRQFDAAQPGDRFTERRVGLAHRLRRFAGLRWAHPGRMWQLGRGRRCFANSRNGNRIGSTGPSRCERTFSHRMRVR